MTAARSETPLTPFQSFNLNLDLEKNGLTESGHEILDVSMDGARELRPFASGTTSGTEHGLDADGPECVVHPAFRLQRWLLEKIETRASPEEILAALQKRLIQGKSDLHEVQRILNDLGRRPGGAAVVKAVVTQEAVSKFHRLRPR